MKGNSILIMIWIKLIMNIRLLFTLCIVCSVINLSSCTSVSSPDESLVIEVDLSTPNDNLPLSEFVERIESIRLELPNPHFFGIVSDVIFKDSTLFVIDEKQDKVFRFNEDGAFLNTIGQRGEGPEEFQGISSFFLGDSCVFICDMSARRIYSYAYDGAFIGAISFPFSLVFDNILALPGGDFLCHRLGRSKKNRGLWIMNAKGEKVRTLLNIDKVYPSVSSDWNTLSIPEPGRIGVYEPPTGEYFLLDTKLDTLEKKWQLKPNFKMLSDFKGAQEVWDLTDSYASCQMIVDSKNSLFSVWTNPDDKVIFAFFDKQTKSMRTSKQPKMDFEGYHIMGLPVSSNLPGTLVTTLTDECPLEYFPTKYQNEEMNERVAVINIFKFK